jgi:hypothetical protein
MVYACLTKFSGRNGPDIEKVSSSVLRKKDCQCWYKVAGNFDPPVAANFDSPKSKRYLVWKQAKVSSQEGGKDERGAAKRNAHDVAGRLAHTGHLPESRHIAEHGPEDIAGQSGPVQVSPAIG